MASQSVDDWCAAILGEDPQLVSTSSGLHNLESLTVDDIDDSPRKMGTASSSTDVAMPTALDAPSVLEPCPEQPDLPPLVHEEDECPRVVQEELRQPSTPAAPAADDPILRDSVYRHWVPHIRDPLKALKELRGPFSRELVCASLFDGMRSERKVLQLFSIPTRWLFSMEKKDAAVALGHDQFPPEDGQEHHFLDAAPFLGGTTGECMYHEFGQCDISEIEAFVIDVLFCTFSCQPYTKAGKNRMKPGAVESHKDAFHVDVLYQILRAVRPKAVVFENVFGYALATSTVDPQSPLNKMLAFLAAEFGEWSVGIFVAEGNTYMILIRHRLFIVMVHDCAGGSETIAMLRKVVEVPSCTYDMGCKKRILEFWIPMNYESNSCEALIRRRMGQPSLQLNDVLLDDEHERVRAEKEHWAGQTHAVSFRN